MLHIVFYLRACKLPESDKRGVIKDAFLLTRENADAGHHGMCPSRECFQHANGIGSIRWFVEYPTVEDNDSVGSNDDLVANSLAKVRCLLCREIRRHFLGRHIGCELFIGFKPANGKSVASLFQELFSSW